MIARISGEMTMLMEDGEVPLSFTNPSTDRAVSTNLVNAKKLQVHRRNMAAALSRSIRLRMSE